MSNINFDIVMLVSSIVSFLHVFIIIAPFFVFLFISFFGIWGGKDGSVVVAIVIMFLSSFFAYIEVFFIDDFALFSSNVRLSWFFNREVDVDYIFFSDPLSIVMLFVVTIISTFVHIYSYGYMKYEPQLCRFVSYLSLFTFFMNVLVTSGNLVQMFFGWEGVGLASFLLINMWFNRLDATKAALKAIVLNRFGDFCFIIGMLIVYDVFGSFDFLVINCLTSYVSGEALEFFGFEINKVSLMAFFFVIAAMAKSAQFGLHVWLPDAMEGPTPVSALIHAATMVTAGVFLLVRISSILDYSGWVLGFIVLIGGITSLFGSSVAFVQMDIKKIIAYSTCSQLGYMFIACGMSQYGLAVFHLLNHAFFKALLFLSAGCIIFVLNGQQDIRQMGGLYRYMPLTFIFMSFGSFSLGGGPFLSGYYSKDLILEILYGMSSLLFVFVFFLGSLSAFFTLMYSMRLIYFVFLVEPAKYYNNIQYHVVDLFGVMIYSLIKLVFFSIISGFFFLFNFVRFEYFGFVFGLPIVVYMLDVEFIFILVKIFFVMLSLLFIIFMPLSIIERDLNGLANLNIGSNILCYFYEFRMNVMLFLTKSWYIDDLYNYLVIFYLKFSYEYGLKGFDSGIINFFGFRALVNLVYDKFGGFIGWLQSGFMYHYMFFSFFFIIILYCFDNLINIDGSFFYVLVFSIFYIFGITLNSNKC